MIKRRLKGILLEILEIIPAKILINFKKIHYLRSLKNFNEKNEPDFEVVKYIARKGDTVFDIGANIGWYTKLLSELVGETGKVISIDPTPETFLILSYCVKRLGLSNVNILNCAISNKEGVCKMEVPKYDFGGLNFYQTRITDNNKKNYLFKYFFAKTKSLDGFIPCFADTVSFIKCDVEGHELAVIKGALSIISKFKPIWLIEVSSDPDQTNSSAFELFKIMQENGYIAYWYKNQKLYKRIKGDKSINYFFITSERLKQLPKTVLYDFSINEG